MEVYLRTFLISSEDGGDWSTSCTSWLMAEQKVSNFPWIEAWVDPAAGLDVLEKGIKTYPCWEKNHSFLVVYHMRHIVVTLINLTVDFQWSWHMQAERINLPQSRGTKTERVPLWYRL
jgi:hypothetical protein